MSQYPWGSARRSLYEGAQHSKGHSLSDSLCSRLREREHDLRKRVTLQMMALYFTVRLKCAIVRAMEMRPYRAVLRHNYTSRSYQEHVALTTCLSDFIPPVLSIRAQIPSWMKSRRHALYSNCKANTGMAGPSWLTMKHLSRLWYSRQQHQCWRAHAGLCQAMRHHGTLSWSSNLDSASAWWSAAHLSFKA